MKQNQHLTAVQLLLLSSLALSPALVSAKVDEKSPQLIPIEPICQLNVDECDDPYQPPQIAPSTPKKITVSRQQGSGTVTVKWKPGAAGSGTNFRYELVRQVKNQSGSLVYSGTTASRTLNAGTNQAVRFQIRACNSAGCSSYKSSDYFLINGQFNNGGATTAPLEQMSQSAALALKTAGTEYRLMGENDTAAAVLGNGFDALKGEVYGNSCWNTTGLNKIDSVQNVNEQKYSFRQVDSYESLATSLDIKRSGGGSLSFGGLSIGGSGSKALYSETSKVTESSVIVASFTDRRNVYQAKQAVDLAMQANYTSMLTSGQKLEFRKACGDKFIDTVTTGRKMTFTIRVEKESSSYSEIKSKTLELKASLEQYSADGNFSSAEKSTMQQSFQGYSFEIIGTQAGGSTPNNLLRLNDITQFMTVLNDFANSASSDLVAISSTERDYAIPAGMSGSHFSVFTNYTPYRDILASWGRLDHQVEKRCWMLNTDSVNTDVVIRTEQAMGDRYFMGNVSEGQLCDATKDMIDRFTNYCANQGEWSKCHIATSSACIDSINQGQCMERPELITYKGAALAEKRLDVSRGGCFIGPCKESKTIEQCFSSNSIIPDFARNKVFSTSYQPTPLSGLVVTVDRAWQVNYVRNSISNISGKYCFKSSAEVYGKGGWGSGGRYESNNQMFGFDIRSLGYLL
jgi:hypothetical protein